MREKLRRNQRWLLLAVIIICMGIILGGGIDYIKKLQKNLQEHAIQNVMTVTIQQQQAFNNFITGDQERLHSFAEYFAKNDHSDAQEIQRQLTMFNEVDAIYSVICLDEGWFCSNASEAIRQVDEENLEYYRSLTGRGVRDTYIGLFSGSPKFGYYETFTFNNGHRGLIQKSYDRSKVSETFSLSFYNNQGLAYIVNQDGDILLRSVGMIGDRLYENIFDVVTDVYGQQADISSFMDAISTQQTGSMIFTGDKGAYVYSYVPVGNAEEWYLVSIVPMEAITMESNQILMDSQMIVTLLALVPLVCVGCIALFWRTHKDIEAKDRAVEYQTQLFNIFTTYLSRNTDDMYMMLDHETDEVEYISPNVERVLGVNREDVIDSMKASDLSVDAEAAKIYYVEVASLLPGESKSWSTERINAKTGERKYFLENTYCTIVQGKRKRVVYISDRTKERKIQDSLSEALQMARAANDAKSAFLSSVSHDIRTPMNAIIGFLTLMRDEADKPEMVREYAQRIDAASQHLLGLINDVLDMNKIESGSTTLSISDLNLAEIIDEINTIIRPQTKEKKQTFEIMVSHLAYEHLMGDKVRINQILINLLSNALKYTPENGTIRLRVEELPQVVNNYSRIRFTISDNGMGMSDKYLKVIFDPFTREDSVVDRQIQGTGLGMAITKSLVDLMGGTICVESELNKGSTFTVELELRIQEREEDEDHGFWEEHGVKRMIVADDEEETCRNIVKTMAKAGIAVDYSTNGETVIQMMRSAREAGKPYDVILLDWKMPNLNGLETARLIRQNYPEKIPILLLTAYDWSEIEQEAAEIGVNHFMPKPFFMSTFKEAIRRVMGSIKREEVRALSSVKGKHILVVDDIEPNRIVLVKILTSQGAVCNVAKNGQEAVDVFEASKPGDYDLILMDVQMPVMNGYDATRTIRSSSHPMAKKIPIIAMTANAFVDDVRDAIESGMDAHIAKPVQRDKLSATIQEVLENRLVRAEEEKRKKK